MPTQTFTMPSTDDDAYVFKSSVGVWPPTSAVTVNTVDTDIYGQKEYRSGTNEYVIMNGLMRWDTSSLPDDAIITSATLRGYVTFQSTADAKSLTADWYTWNATVTDYSETAQTNALSGKSINAFTLSAYNDTALENGNDYINRTGYTYLRLHLSDGAQPTARNYLSFASYDHATANPPELIVTYKLYDAHVGNDIAVDETTTNPSRVLNAAPATSDYGMVSRQLNHPTAPVPCSFTTASGGIGGSTNEALATLTPVRDFTTGSAATAFTVPAGKTMRVTGFWGVARRDTGTGSITWELEMNLHVNTGGTATTSSPIVFSGVAAWTEAAASTTLWIGTNPVWFEIPGGIDLPAGASFALGYRNSSSQPTRTTNAICVTGFEY